VNSRYRQKLESRASLDLFIKRDFSRGNRWRMSKKIETHRHMQEWIDAQTAACQGHHLKHERRRRYAALRSEVLTVQRQAAVT